jgi:hypothetical protein
MDIYISGLKRQYFSFLTCFQYLYMYIISTNVYIFFNTHTYMNICIYIYIYICICIYIYIYTYVYVYIYIYIHMYMYIYIYIYIRFEEAILQFSHIYSILNNHYGNTHKKTLQYKLKLGKLLYISHDYTKAMEIYKDILSICESPIEISTNFSTVLNVHSKSPIGARGAGDTTNSKYAGIYVYIDICKWLCIYICICIYIHIYICFGFKNALETNDF